jgi:hypothetical protein
MVTMHAPGRTLSVKYNQVLIVPLQVLLHTAFLYTFAAPHRELVLSIFWPAQCPSLPALSNTRTEEVVRVQAVLCVLLQMRYKLCATASIYPSTSHAAR